MKPYPIMILIALSLPAPSVFAATEVNVLVAGEVAVAGNVALPEGARISAAALAAQPTQDAYFLGAALLRNEAQREQTRLKAGLLFELESIMGSGDPETEAIADNLHDFFASLPVTGRVPHLLEPRALEATLVQDRPALEGDKLIYPARPDTVTVVGAVAAPCILAHAPEQTPIGYARQCARSTAASKDDLYVVQPDGAIQKIGIALWNRSTESVLAPGAVVYVPLANTAAAGDASELNKDAARFLATQVLPTPGVEL